MSKEVDNSSDKYMVKYTMGDKNNCIGAVFDLKVYNI